MSALSAKQKAIRQRLKDDYPHYARKCLKIRPREGTIVPLDFNEVQVRLHQRIEEHRAATGKVRVIILKARQPGISTYVAGRFFHSVTHRRGVRAFILTHKDDATSNLFGMAKRFYEHLPEPVRPEIRASNARELDFGLLDSGYRVGTAKAEGVGRSQTIQYLHGSEVAFWSRADEHAAGVLQAVPDVPGTEVILESTANGYGGLFYDMCVAAEAGRGAFELIFVPWFWHDVYAAEPPEDWQPSQEWSGYGALHDLTPQQLYWAWQKNEELAIAIGADASKPCWKFHQEYPATAQDAFQAGSGDSLIASDVVLQARQRSLPDTGNQYEPLVLGVDVARGGADQSRIIDRIGRRYGHVCNSRIDTDDLMQVAAYVQMEIERLRPDRVFVDATGGYGSAVCDRLRELGYSDIVTGVEFGGKPLDQSKYANKRAEMWALLRDHLLQPGGCDLVDDDELHRHLVAPSYSFDSSGKLLLESKKDIRKRLGLSPDGGDAAALTHAGPVRRRGEMHQMPPQADSGYSVLRW